MTDLNATGRIELLPKLTGEQRKKILDEISKGNEQPTYRLTTTLGDYSTTIEFPDETPMRRYIEKQKPGLWYDWSVGESNDPNWGERQYGKVIAYDTRTNERIGRILFYHSGSHHLERHALKEGRAVVSDCGDTATIVEIRELRFEFPECQALPANPDATFPIQEDLTIDDESWRDKPPML